MTDFALVTNNDFRATLRTEEGSLLECRGDPISGGGATGASTSFVFRPGAPGPKADGVFTTPAALKAALLTVDTEADKTIVVDTSFGAAHLTAADSPWPLDNTTIESHTIVILTVDAGATFSPGTSALRLRNIELAIDAASAATVWTPTPTAAFLDLQEAIVVNASAVPWIQALSGITLAITARVGSTFSGVQAKIENGALVDALIFDGSQLPASTFVHGTAVGGLLAVSLDGSSQAGVSQVQDNANLVVTFTTLDPQPTFVFQPGGVAGGNVFSTWATLAAAVALTPGPRTILVDDSLAAAHMTAGGPYDLDNVTFRCNEASASFTLIIDEGATFTSTYLIVDGLLISSRTTGVSPWTPASFFALRLFNGSDLLSTVGSKPFLQVNAAATFSQLILDAGTALGDSAHNVISVAVGQELEVLVTGPQFSSGGVEAHTFGGLGTVHVTADDGASVSDTQDVATFTRSFQTTPNFVQQQANTGTGTNTTTAVTGNIAKLRSGKVNVSGSVSGIMTAGGTVTVSLLRDATPILTLGALTYLATSSYSIPIEFIDTLPDTANHTYTVKAVASAGNLTVPTNGNGIVATEM